MNRKIEVSNQWKKINNELFGKSLLSNIENFKSEPAFYKLAMWNPETNGTRYYKALLYMIASTLSDDVWAILKNTKKRSFGGGLHSIKFNGELVCLDYIQSALELDYILRNVKDSKRIVEIGAGYGRTAHTIISNIPTEKYYIIDLPNCLKLSRKYLEAVLSAENYKKIVFINALKEKDVESLPQVDLAINIDSFAEMDKKTINLYYELIDKKTTYFYTKNPVGKYMDSSLNNDFDEGEAVENALSSGPLTTILDIQDEDAILGQVENFIMAYTPSVKWNVVSNDWAKPWSFYWQAIFKKEI